jgi:hypothetical protein
MSPKGMDERYQEWLERMEIPIENTTNIEIFKDYLRDEFGITDDPRITALWDAVDKTADLAEHGIYPVTVNYVTRGFKELRYGVQGLPGLWGWAAVQEIMSEEE